MPTRAWLCFLFLVACDGAPPPTPDAGPDEEILGCGRALAFPALSWPMASIGMPVGMTREVALELVRDCPPGVTVTLEASADGIVGFPATAEITADFDRVYVALEGLAEGRVTLTARVAHEASGDMQMAAIEVVVAPIDVPACDGDASGTVSPGSALTVERGGLAGAAITLPEGAARDDRYHVDPFEATIACGEAQVPEGYRALGPAVAFGPAHTRFARDVPLTVPLRMLALPAGANRGHVEVSFRGPHDAAGRIVAIASPIFGGSADDGWLSFEVPRLGTYQAVVRESAPVRRSRRFAFRGILGFSMGGSGSGRIGFGNPDRFDFVAPLGGPTDWTFMLEHIRNYHVGGFCTEAQRQLDPTGCAAGASLANVPPTEHLHEHPQHFEHWWFEDENDGNSTFRRNDYIEIFRDLSTMFGNPNTEHSADPSEPNIVPPGVPDSTRMLSDAERCASPVVIAPFDGTGDPLSGSEGAGFFDDEFNPDAQYPVITFCDGYDAPGDIGLWDPSLPNDRPIEVVLAVDVDGDGRRGPGEPLIRNGREPFEDVGLDGVPNELEVSADGAVYDAVTNPDPAGDDFHFQYRPAGTERNWNRDTPDNDPCNASGEPFLDVGLDGVLGTRQLAPAGDLPGGGFDFGEGNGCFDRTSGARRMIESSPRSLVAAMDEQDVLDTDLFSDGGIRDLFNWVVMGDVTSAGWAARGLPVRYYNGYPALHMNGALELTYQDVRWDEIGRYAMVRYGNIDEEERFIRAGDGGHVGTASQLIDRFRSGLAVMDARWPDGDRRREVEDRVCAEGDREVCGYVNSFVMDFTASDGRTGPVSVVLPPGYFFEENQGVRYPVVYFLHGYGMSPEDLVAIGLLMFEAMNSPRVGSSRRMQKIILVFPDGHCRGEECLNGTFYTDAPDNVPGGGRVQTFMLELMDHMDENYRTRMPETFEVVE